MKGGSIPSCFNAFKQFKILKKLLTYRPINISRIIFFSLLLCTSIAAKAQTSNPLLAQAKAKLDKVNNYEGDAMLVTDIPFLKVPRAAVKVYFKKPDKIKIRNEKGISFVPKGAVTINLNSLLSSSNMTVLDGGTILIAGKQTRIVKLLPQDDTGDVILSTVYIDEANAVIVKARTTNKDNGTYDLNMKYGKYTAYGLPDEVIFTFNTKDYKMPKGVTFDYDDASKTNHTGNTGPQEGKIILTYTSYKINAGVSDDIFK